MSIQLITTKEPSDDKIELAIYTLFGCMNGNKQVSISKFVKDYLLYNKSIKKDFDIKDALIIFSNIKSMNTNDIYINMDGIMLDYNEQIKASMMLDKLYKKNIPMAYIIGKISFYNENYIINNDVLIPRVDSEILVEKAIEYIDKENLNTMLDMCTGTGCLGISISKNSNIKHTTLVDISNKALKIASKNVTLNEINDKCSVCNSDLFSNFKKSGIKYDIIVSNPPYIPTKDINNLDESVKKEPIIALDGGKDGMNFYRKILKQALNYLNNNAVLIFEIGYDELEKFKKIINRYTEYKIVESLKDYGGNDRVVICRFQSK